MAGCHATALRLLQVALLLLPHLPACVGFVSWLNSPSNIRGWCGWLAAAYTMLKICQRVAQNEKKLQRRGWTSKGCVHMAAAREQGLGCM